MNAFERGKRNEAILSYEEVAAILGYDEICCDLYWKVNRSNVKAGSVAGTPDGKEYRRVKVNGVRFSAHRVIWLLVHKRWPADQLDHIDGNPLNNDIENLREVSHVENGRNAKLSVRNTSGIVGVGFDSRAGKWGACIKVNGRQINSPYYRFKWSAIAWRRRMERRYGFHANHGRQAA